MKAIIIEDETTAVNSLKAVLAAKYGYLRSSDRRVGEYRGERGFLPDIASSGYHLHGYPFSGRIGVQDIRAGGDRCPGSLHDRLR